MKDVVNHVIEEEMVQCKCDEGTEIVQEKVVRVADQRLASEYR